jgi:hypothetical protein
LYQAGKNLTTAQAQRLQADAERIATLLSCGES